MSESFTREEKVQIDRVTSKMMYGLEGVQVTAMNHPGWGGGEDIRFEDFIPDRSSYSLVARASLYLRSTSPQPRQFAGSCPLSMLQVEEMALAGPDQIYGVLYDHLKILLFALLHTAEREHQLQPGALTALYGNSLDRNSRFFEVVGIKLVEVLHRNRLR